MNENFKIIVDSGCDLSTKIKEMLNVKLVPLTLQLKDKIYRDDEQLDVKQYIEDMRKCEIAPKTACPSPEDFVEAYDVDEDNVFVVTLSEKLSGTFNSAKLAKDIYTEENKDKRIHVFNSKTASIGETLVALKIHELVDKYQDFNEVKETVENYIDEMKTFFMLENLDHLAKAGRLKTAIVKIMNILNIKLVLGASDEGDIRLVNKVRGSKKAFKRFVDVIGEEGKDFENKILGIAHCNCLEKAQAFKREVLKRYNFKEIIIVETAGISTTYADEGGIVVAF